MISIYYQRSEEMLHWKARESYQSLSREEKTKSTSIHATNMGSFLWKLDLMKKKKTKKTQNARKLYYNLSEGKKSKGVKNIENFPKKKNTISVNMRVKNIETFWKKKKKSWTIQKSF